MEESEELLDETFCKRFPPTPMRANLKVLVCSSHWDEMIVARRFIAGKA